MLRFAGEALAQLWVLGRDADLVIDSGMGIAPLRPVIDALVALPLVLLFLLLRSLRNAGYRARWSERFGRFSGPARTGGIAVHAASLGEVNAASALIAALARHYPDAPLTVTTFTPTGSERVRSVFGEAVFHVYAPLDLPGAVRRFFDRVRPRLLVIMETEIWPNLYHGAAARRASLL